MLLAACETDSYDKGTGENSLTMGDLMTAHANSDKAIDYVTTDNDEKLILSQPVTAKWITTADSTYRQFNLGEVVVTGTRTPKFLKNTPIQTRVISAKEIARLDATNVQDLLQQELPSVEFSYAMNQQTHLNFSGFGGQGVLFLVDGERLAGETMDDVDFTRLSMDNVERIEIVKGAASALYGSNATGGVINIITKNSQKPLTLNVNARYAKHNEQRY